MPSLPGHLPLVVPQRYQLTSHPPDVYSHTEVPPDALARSLTRHFVFGATCTHTPCQPIVRLDSCLFTPRQVNLRL